MVHIHYKHLSITTFAFLILLFAFCLHQSTCCPPLQHDATVTIILYCPTRGGISTTNA